MGLGADPRRALGAGKAGKAGKAPHAEKAQLRTLQAVPTRLSKGIAYETEMIAAAQQRREAAEKELLELGQQLVARARLLARRESVDQRDGHRANE
jgi:hypothetical protein